MQKNLWFKKLIETNQIEEFSQKELWNILDVCFSLFKQNFESDEYDNYEFVAECCKDFLDAYLDKSDWNEFSCDGEKVDFVIDIVCFIYELTYRYDEKMQILKKIAETEKISRAIRLRALENMLPMMEGATYFDEDEIERYSVMYYNLKHN